MTRRLEPELSDEFDDVADVESYFDLGQRRLTDVARQVVEVRQGGWAGWLVAATVIAVALIVMTWGLVSLVWPADEEINRLQARLRAAQQRELELQTELTTLRDEHDRLEAATDKLSDEVEQTVEASEGLEDENEALEAKLTRERQEAGRAGANKRKRRKKKRRRR